MIIVLVILGFIVSVSPGLAQRGDTTWVRAFENYLWTWHGGQNRWATFPDSGRRYEKILMHYRLKCPTGGCGEWDYTSSVYIMDHTGRIDSSIQAAPSFRVDGAIVDSVSITSVQTYSYVWNASRGRADTVANPPLKIVYYSDPANPWRAVDSISAFKGGYYNYSYNSIGGKTDSTWVPAERTLYVTKVDAYLPFEVVVPYEIGRFITPYGKWFAKDREFDWVFDVTEYASMLHDSVEIRTFYDGWSQGSLYTLDFELIEGVPPVDVYRVENIYGGGFAYGNPGDPIENHLPARTLTIDPASTYTQLKIVTTGHGFGGTENAAEFSDKTHHVTVDGTRRFDQRLWRDDCGQNPVYPQAGTWYFDRAGWCPGDLVHPNYYNLTPFVTPGSPSTIDYNMQPYVNADLSHGASYIIQAQVLYATGPNFRNDAEMMEIKTPTDAFKYHRLNPICNNSSPTIIIRNRGSEPLTRLTIGYGASESTSTFNWTGNLKFMETAEVTLPAIDLGEGAGRFVVTLSNPNGVADEYASNDGGYANYEMPKSYSNRVFLQLRTDDFANDPNDYNGISWELRDLAGSVLYSGGGYPDRFTHRDTFNLADGCYQFVIVDGMLGLEDGLFPIQGTAGSYSLRDDRNQTIINGAASGPLYLASFGDREVTTFTVRNSSRVRDEKVGALEGVRIYPNPSQGEISIDLAAITRPAVTSVEVHTLLGERVIERSITPADPSTVTVDLSAWPAGSYVVSVRAGDLVRSEQVVVGR